MLFSRPKTLTLNYLSLSPNEHMYNNTHFKEIGKGTCKNSVFLQLLAGGGGSIKSVKGHKWVTNG